MDHWVTVHGHRENFLTSVLLLERWESRVAEIELEVLEGIRYSVGARRKLCLL